MAEYDLIIRSGLVVDGSGAEPFEADVAVRSGRIAAVGRLSANSGAEEIDARGLLVTPGFVDLHTHYDGHVTWMERLIPTSIHGVTTALFGNCGVGFAPCKPEDRDRLVRLMEGVEDIPEPVLTEGLPWNWVTFPDYLESLDTRRFDIDIAAQISHGPVRVFVMGKRAADREPATDEDVAMMAGLVREAILAGAFGFSTSRSINHRASDGSHTPTLGASERELRAISASVGGTGRGVLQMISDFEDINRDFDLVRMIARTAGRPLSLSVLQLPHAPARWRDILDRIAAANSEGLQIRGQVCGRPVGLCLGLELTFTPFAFCPTFQAMKEMGREDKLKQLNSSQIRARILEESAVPLERRKVEIAKAFASRTVDSFSMARLLTDFTGMFPLGDPPEYEPPATSSIAALAARSGVSPAEIAYNTLLENGGNGLIYVPAANFADRTLDSVRTMLAHENTILGLGDAGAHSSLICDASFTTYMLTHWARDRKNGLSLAEVVHALTRQGAAAIGLMDRGLIATGLRADINVIDFTRLRLHAPKLVRDLPAGGGRLSQDVEGYVVTVVNGIPTYRDGKATGELPGRLMRSNSIAN